MLILFVHHWFLWSTVINTIVRTFVYGYNNVNVNSIKMLLEKKYCFKCLVFKKWFSLFGFGEINTDFF